MDFCSSFSKVVVRLVLHLFSAFYLKFMEFPFEKIFSCTETFQIDFLFDKLGHPVILLSHFVV